MLLRQRRIRQRVRWPPHLCLMSTSLSSSAQVSNLTALSPHKAKKGKSSLISNLAARDRTCGPLDLCEDDRDWQHGWKQKRDEARRPALVHEPQPVRSARFVHLHACHAGVELHDYATRGNGPGGQDDYSVVCDRRHRGHDRRSTAAALLEQV